jgi:hypothetical protein
VEEAEEEEEEEEAGGWVVVVVAGHGITGGAGIAVPSINYTLRPFAIPCCMLVKVTLGLSSGLAPF